MGSQICTRHLNMNRIFNQFRVFIIYAISSLTITFLSFVYFYFLNKILDYRSTYAIVFCIAVLSQYISQTYIVFKVKSKSANIFYLFLVYITQAFGQFFILYYLVEVANLDEIHAFILSTFLVFPLTYIVNKRILAR